MSHTVELSPAAITDIMELLDYLLPLAGERVARRYVDDIIQFCMGFETFPMRGEARNDLAPGMRVTGYHRKASIAFSVQDERVIILRIFYGGRDIRFEKE